MHESVARLGGQAVTVQQRDAATAETDQPTVGELAEDLGGGFPGRADQGGDLLVGEADLFTPGRQ